MIPCGIWSVLKSGLITSTVKNLLKHQFDPSILSRRLCRLHFWFLNPKTTIKPQNDIEMLINKEVVKKPRTYVIKICVKIDSRFCQDLVKICCKSLF